MKLTILFVAAAYLLTTSATAITAPAASLAVARDDTVNTPATQAGAAVSVNKGDNEPNSDVHMAIGGWPGGSQCGTYGCNYGVNHCVEDCGRGPQCKPYCECKLYSNPNSLCRTQGCVKAPKNCDKYDKKKRDVDDKVVTDNSGPVTKLDCDNYDKKKRDIDDKAIMDNLDPVMKLDVSGPFNPCYECKMAYDVCVKKCGLGPGCSTMCKCQPIGPNSTCKQCPELQCLSIVYKLRQDAKILGDT
ncbi:hypothetical protein PtrSN002B_011252 [Pyrenophora tritici-repentis]|uniref:Uncharacterized protein n=2 Tax=Pyrenophora tritici-repentis TaxID=45151 RepID=A0A2W1FEI2_9PLEO|nr:uncharacterized protein PTRG_08021 [Pyrenophora tritici-repentis Pt-1C-BFP]KAA8616635.1 hypothetical protein PtrV1_09936 [Pyrenophora tritici-repentis]EDU50940.1 predicted protein [Pyrenophora tritici-repentis Pt-1C-BFP]KAF7445930.1 hypothetical protein A1F99_092210 [Pyrenophora tritici-repentis]KAF7567026.1 hypothetical protein PtrM4_136170 [Pyrenophora tritici-repentis]KAG9381640.1 hypothetical protein A1F94_007294 [Pyrenophora tritici-repentis]